MSVSGLVSGEFPATVLVNTSSGRGGASSHVQIQNLFAAGNFASEFIFPVNAAELEYRAREALRAGRKLLIAMGGDGTLQALANASYGNDVVLGIIPTGGGNDVAAALGIPTKDPLAAARLILSAKFEARSIDVLRARTADGRERIYLGGGGLGLDADAAHLASTRYRHLRGRLRYVAAALRALHEFQPLRVRLESCSASGSGELPSIESEALLVAALNTPSYGAGIRLALGTVVDDGFMTVAILKNLSSVQVLGLLPKLMARGNVPEKYVRRVTARCVRLIPNRPCDFHGDGEILGPAPVEIEVAPRAVRVLAPAAM